MSRVDAVIKWVGERAIVARTAFTKKAPQYITWEAGNYRFNLNDYLFQEYSDSDLQEYSQSIPWIYSNVNRIANEAISADLMIMERETDEEKKDHDFSKVWQRPNPFFSASATLEYALRCMLLDEWGGYWFLFPNVDNPMEILEIWPVPANRMVPIRDKTDFLTHYAYFVDGVPMTNRDLDVSKNYQRIPASHVCRFFNPDPTDLWRNLTPLQALRSGINVYENISSSQESLFGAGGGVPLSIVLLDKFMSEPDFIQARTQIMEDWQAKKRIAVARGGGLEVKNVGISNKDLEVVESLRLNRDEIDSVYMTLPWRSEGTFGGETRRQIDREIKSAVIFPMLKKMGEQITTQIIYPFYDQECVARFTDVRKQDKALEIQEHAVDWRGKSFDEARRDMNLAPYSLPKWFTEKYELDDGAIGELPFQWVSSPSFMATVFGLNTPQEEPEQQDEEIGQEEQLTPQGGDDAGPGNIDEAIAPEAETNLEANDRQRNDRTDANVDMTETMKVLLPIQREGIRTELKRYRKVLLSRMQQGQSPRDVEFSTEIVPTWMMDRIKGQVSLLDSNSQDEIRLLFGELIQ